MKINKIQHFPQYIDNKNIKNSFSQPITVSNDSFQCSNQNNNVSFKGEFFSSLWQKITEKYRTPQKIIIPTAYSAQLAEGVKRVMGLDIPISNFDDFISADEFRKILPTLKQDNFLSNSPNYSIDLDYQTTFSSGVENVFTVIEKVKKHADKHFNETGEPFYFALTDRDSIEGVQHAIKIIASDPDRYKNIKLIPGVRMSFTHKAPSSKIGYENSDMLIYGINPFDPKLMNFIDRTIEKRKEMAIDFIKAVYERYPEFAYSVVEFAAQNKIIYNKSFTVSNLYWRAREYAETKGDSAIRSIDLPPKQIMEEATRIIHGIGNIYTNQKIDGGITTIIDENDVDLENVNLSIRKVFEKYSTHYDEKIKKVVSSAENLFEDMISLFEEQNPVMAIGSPYYLSHHFKKEGDEEGTLANVVDFIHEMQKNSKGMIVAFESVAPSYDIDSALSPIKDCPTDKKISDWLLEKFKKNHTVNIFNEYIRKHTSLYEVGGSFANRPNKDY